MAPKDACRELGRLNFRGEPSGHHGSILHDKSSLAKVLSRFDEKSKVFVKFMDFVADLKRHGVACDRRISVIDLAYHVYVHYTGEGAEKVLSEYLTCQTCRFCSHPKKCEGFVKEKDGWMLFVYPMAKYGKDHPTIHNPSKQLAYSLFAPADEGYDDSVLREMMRSYSFRVLLKGFGLGLERFDYAIGSRGACSSKSHPHIHLFPPVGS